MVPNPTSGKLSISLNDVNSNANDRITSLTGQVVYTGSFATSTPQNLTSELQSGVYFVAVSTASAQN
jgi:hypothetical protein